jgi:hypothetical protein
LQDQTRPTFALTLGEDLSDPERAVVAYAIGSSEETRDAVSDFDSPYSTNRLDRLSKRQLPDFR